MHDCTPDELLDLARTHVLAAVLDVPKVATLAGLLRSCIDDAARAGDKAMAAALQHAAEQLERRLAEG